MSFRKVIVVAVCGTLAWFGWARADVSSSSYSHDIAEFQESQEHVLTLDTMPRRSIGEVRAIAPEAFAIPTISDVIEGSFMPEGPRADLADIATADGIIRTAMQYLGARYRSGSAGPYAFDCSGFTSYIFGKQGYSLTRSSRSQYHEGEAIRSIAELRKGDLVFFTGSNSRGGIGHVGIVTEVNPEANRFRFIHAATGGVKVSESSEAYYSRRYVGARRVLVQ